MYRDEAHRKVCESLALHGRYINAARNILTEGKRILSDTQGTAGHAGTVAAITA